MPLGRSYVNLQLQGTSEVESSDKTEEFRKASLYTRPDDDITDENSELKKTNMIMQVNSMVGPNQ